jgi:hypothetical protein
MEYINYVQQTKQAQLVQQVKPKGDGQLSRFQQYVAKQTMLQRHNKIDRITQMLLNDQVPNNQKQETTPIKIRKDESKLK